MQNKDYGLFIQNMRKTRGFTQTQAASAAGVSYATLRNLESTSDAIKIRSSNLDAILVALAMRSYLNAGEIKTIAEGANRTYESLERLNARAELLIAEQSGDQRTRPAPITETSYEHRAIMALRILESGGQAEAGIAMLEAMARQVSDQITAESRTPKTTPPNER